MSFLGLIKNIKSSPKTKTNFKNNNSLQAQKDKTNAYTDIFYSQNPKRMSPVTFKWLKAGVSIEAAIAVPIFLFFIINIISLISIFDRYSEALSRVQQQARVVALESNNINDSGDEIVTFSEQVAIVPVFDSIGFTKSNTTAMMSYRKWTGYNLNKSKYVNSTDEYVYITEHGTSYHRNRNCKHLKVTILISDINGIVKKRNSSGGKYTPCERCGGNGTGIIFYTPDGNRYHSSANCSGLKRNIKYVKLSDVGGRKECKSCR